MQLKLMVNLEINELKYVLWPKSTLFVSNLKDTATAKVWENTLNGKRMFRHCQRQNTQ